MLLLTYRSPHVQHRYPTNWMPSKLCVFGIFIYKGYTFTLLLKLKTFCCLTSRSLALLSLGSSTGSSRSWSSMTLLLPQCRLTSTSLKPELSRDTNTEIQEYRIRGTGAGGVRLHLDQSAGPFTNLPQHQICSNILTFCQHSHGNHHDSQGAANQRNGQEGRLSVVYNWSAVTASAAV